MSDLQEKWNQIKKQKRIALAFLVLWVAILMYGKTFIKPTWLFWTLLASGVITFYYFAIKVFIFICPKCNKKFFSDGQESIKVRSSKCINCGFNIEDPIN